ncbi:MAG: glycosyltransferase family 4 protein [candidate division Zixibacteria bacterium]|nr:glycosyltransferase family 4 protein [candidate division Zixibacteria bacterium]
MDFEYYPSKSKPRILFVAPTPPPHAGPENVSAGYLESKQLHSHYEICHLRSNVNTCNKNKGKIRISSLFRFGFIFIKYIHLLISFKPDAVYTLLAQNRVGVLRDIIYIYTAYLFKSKIFCTFHGEEFAFFLDRQPDFFRKLIKSALGKIDIMMLQGENLRNQFFDIIPPSKFRIVPNGIDLDLFKSYDIKRRKFSSNKNTVMFLGSLVPSKGFVDLYEVAKDIVKEYKDFNFIFVGEMCDSDYNITHDLSGRKVPGQVRIINKHPRIKFTGSLYDKDKIEKLFSSDVFVLPSYSESMPIVVLEAMAAGMPMLLTAVGALPEILREGHNCHFVSPGNREELKERILKLSADVELRKYMSVTNYNLVNNEFSISRMQDRFLKVFDEIYYPFNEPVEKPKKLATVE